MTDLAKKVRELRTFNGVVDRNSVLSLIAEAQRPVVWGRGVDARWYCSGCYSIHSDNHYRDESAWLAIAFCPSCGHPISEFREYGS